MTITRGEIKSFVLGLLQKTPGYQGMFTDAKLNDATQEALDYIATHMFESGHGMMKKIIYLKTTAGRPTIDLPGNICLIDTVRYKDGDYYMPIDAYTAEKTAYYSGSNNTQIPSSFRIVGQSILFNPAPDVTEEDKVMVEFSGYPDKLYNDGQEIEPDIDTSAGWYIKYRVARTVWNTVSTNARFPHQNELDEWFSRCKMIISQRIRNPTYIGDFS